MLKSRIPATVFTALNPLIQAEYKKDGDKEEYILDTDIASGEDVTNLKSALAAEKSHRLSATQRAEDLQGKLAVAEASRGSVSDVEKAWQKRFDDKIKELGNTHKEEINKAKGQLRQILVDDQALKLASEISTSPTLLLPHIKNRLSMEEQDGKLICRVLDKDGKASALSINDLQKEIVEEKSFAPIIKASGASGGGASGSGKGGGSSSGGKKFTEMTEADKVALHKADPTEYRRLRDAEKTS